MGGSDALRPALRVRYVRRKSDDATGRGAARAVAQQPGGRLLPSSTRRTRLAASGPNAPRQAAVTALTADDRPDGGLSAAGAPAHAAPGPPGEPAAHRRPCGSGASVPSRRPPGEQTPGRALRAIAQRPARQTAAPGRPGHTADGPAGRPMAGGHPISLAGSGPLQRRPGGGSSAVDAGGGRVGRRRAGGVLGVSSARSRSVGQLLYSA